MPKGTPVATASVQPMITRSRLVREIAQKLATGDNPDPGPRDISYLREQAGGYPGCSDERVPNRQQQGEGTEHPQGIFCMPSQSQRAGLVKGEARLTAWPPRSIVGNNPIEVLPYHDDQADRQEGDVTTTLADRCRSFLL